MELGVQRTVAAYHEPRVVGPACGESFEKPNRLVFTIAGAAPVGFFGALPVIRTAVRHITKRFGGVEEIFHGLIGGGKSAQSGAEKPRAPHAGVERREGYELARSERICDGGGDDGKGRKACPDDTETPREMKSYFFNHTPLGNPAVLLPLEEERGPVALRPTLSDGLPVRRFAANNRLYPA